MKLLYCVLGLASGLMVGGAFGIGLAYGAGVWAQAQSPNDGSAGSVAIIVILTFPVGALIGGAVGLYAGLKRPRVLYFTLLPLAALLVLGMIVLLVLSRMDRPREFILTIYGTRGAKYAGILVVDGTAMPIKGTLNDTFEVTGLEVEIAAVLLERDGKRQIGVEAIADGVRVERGVLSETGGHQLLRSYGYSQSFGGTATPWSRMTEEEVQSLLDENEMPDDPHFDW